MQYTLPVGKRGVEKPAPRLTKILTEAAINTRGWDGPQAQVQHTCPRPGAQKSFYEQAKSRWYSG